MTLKMAIVIKLAITETYVSNPALHFLAVPNYRLFTLVFFLCDRATVPLSPDNG